MPAVQIVDLTKDIDFSLPPDTKYANSILQRNHVLVIVNLHPSASSYNASRTDAEQDLHVRW